jgi:hypothetical protein
MKLSRQDLLLIRLSLLAICASVLSSAIVLYSSGEYAKEALMDQRHVQNQLNVTVSRLSDAYDDRKNMAAYADEYSALIERKIIGDDQRLDWMEGMENIRQQNLVMNFRYSIAPQKIYSSLLPIKSGDFDIHYSEMKLHFELLHEEQLLNFFAALRNQIKGYYQLEGCTLQRTTPDNAEEHRATARLKAECNGGWITLKNRNVPK